MFENRVKKLLSEGKPAWGAGLGEPSTLMTKITIDTGVDFLWIDTEHTAHGLEAIPMIPVLCRMKGCVPLVRVASLDCQLIKKALDIGASAIMIPQVSNAEEARAAVRHAKYPPQGTRGVSPLWTFYLDVSYEDYLPAANDETCVIVEVESAEGLENLESIAGVEGVDILFAGPMDLSAAVGQIGKLSHPDVQKVIAEIPRRVEACGKVAGITASGVEASMKAYDQGYRLISIGSIARSGSLGLARDLQALRKLTARDAKISDPIAAR